MEEVFIHESAEVSEKSRVGKGTKIWHQAQIRENTILGENCIISKSVYIDDGVSIGNNVKVQNMVSIYKGVEIQDDVFIGPHVVFTNDLYPRALKHDFKINKTLVKKGSSISANSTIICGVTIGKDALIGAGSVVTKDIPDNAIAYGNPAKIKGFICKCGKKLGDFQEVEGSIKFDCGCGVSTIISEKISGLIE